MKVLDSSAIINAKYRNLEEQAITVPEVIQELKDIESKSRAEMAVDSGKLKLSQASAKSREFMWQEAEKHGVLDLLTETDLLVLALAYENKGVLMTDDYDIQNMCRILEMPFGKVKMKGTRRVYKWGRKCKGCGKVYKENIEECEVCGSETEKVGI